MAPCRERAGSEDAGGDGAAARMATGTRAGSGAAADAGAGSGGTVGLLAQWRDPAAAFAALLAAPPGEGARLLPWLLGGALAPLVADMPALAGQAAGEGVPLAGLLAGRLMAAVLFVPLLFYGLAAVVWVLLRLGGRPVPGAGLRLVLFRSLWLVAPLVILRGWAAALWPVLTSPQAALLLGLAIWSAFLWQLAGGLRALLRRG